METNHNDTPTFACDMSAMAPAERQAHLATIDELFGAVQEIRELNNGYSLLPGKRIFIIQKTGRVVLKTIVRLDSQEVQTRG